jgi:hypothetical protein
MQMSCCCWASPAEVWESHYLLILKSPTTGHGERGRPFLFWEEEEKRFIGNEQEKNIVSSSQETRLFCVCGSSNFWKNLCKDMNGAPLPPGITTRTFLLCCSSGGGPPPLPCVCDGDVKTLTWLSGTGCSLLLTRLSFSQIFIPKLMEGFDSTTNF